MFANTYGINLRYGALVQNNKVYSNQIGIFSSGWSYSGSIQNNVVYSNTGTAIDLQGSNGGRIVNNTVFQPVGNALRLESNSSNAQVRSNILDVQNGTPLSVASDSMTGLVNVANVTADPLFVNPAGADGVVGYRASDGYDGGTDDNFYVSKTSPAIDAGDSWNAPQTDALGYGRQDDPAITNAGTSDYYTARPTGTSVYLQGGGPGGVAQIWKADDSYWTLNFPAGFNFPFYDGTYTSVYVSSNGFLQFDSPPAVSNAGNSTAAFLAYRRLAPLWADLRTDLAGNDIYVDTSVTGQVTVRWAATAKLTAGPVNMAVTLFPSGQFRLDYGAGNANLSPTVGASYGNGSVSRFCSRLRRRGGSGECGLRSVRAPAGNHRRRGIRYSAVPARMSRHPPSPR